MDANQRASDVQDVSRRLGSRGCRSKPSRPLTRLCPHAIRGRQEAHARGYRSGSDMIQTFAHDTLNAESALSQTMGTKGR